MSVILVTGASGFVGSHLVPELLSSGHHVVALARTPGAGDRVLGRLDAAQRSNVEVRTGDVTRPDTLPSAMAGIDAVVHLVALPRDHTAGADLRLVNTEGTRAVIVAMRSAGVRRLVHMGAMGVEDDPDLHYASSKAKAEALVRASELDWTILKPSLQFGEGDGFFNIVAGLVRLSPGLVPVPGDGGAKFQPIHAGDVAKVVVRSLADPATVGGEYPLGGPRYWTYREITREVLTALGKKRVIVPMPMPIIRLVAGSAELVHLPFPVATDQLRQFRLDNIGPLDVHRVRLRVRTSADGGCAGLPASGSTRPGAGAAMTTALRQLAGGLVWLVVVLLIALGGAGIVAGTDHPPGSAARPDSNVAGDAEVTAQLDAASKALAGLADEVDQLGTAARGALAALNGSDAATADAAIAAGNGLVTDIIARTASIRSDLAAVPYVATTTGGLFVSNAVVSRHAALVRALDATDGLDQAWSRLTTGSIAASRLSALLAEHDRLVNLAVERGRLAKYSEAIKRIDQASAQLDAARIQRDRLAATVDVSVLDDWIARNADYDVALRDLYRVIPKVGKKVTKTIRAAVAAEAVARSRLPPDPRGLVIIMADIGRGGMNGAVITIEQAKAALADALAHDSTAPADSSATGGG